MAEMERMTGEEVVGICSATRTALTWSANRCAGWSSS